MNYTNRKFRALNQRGEKKKNLREERAKSKDIWIMSWLLMSLHIFRIWWRDHIFALRAQVAANQQLVIHRPLDPFFYHSKPPLGLAPCSCRHAACRISAPGTGDPPICGLKSPASGKRPMISAMWSWSRTTLPTLPCCIFSVNKGCLKQYSNTSPLLEDCREHCRKVWRLRRVRFLILYLWGNPCRK